MPKSCKMSAITIAARTEHSTDHRQRDEDVVHGHKVQPQMSKRAIRKPPIFSLVYTESVV